ncbi:MAG TPA: zinc ribbon domain-containing protein [Longimicrobiales bacterium]
MESVIIALLVVAAAAAVSWPLAEQRRGRWARPPSPLAEAALDEAVGRYRVALRAGTVCSRCRFANPSGSRFCADCGRRLSGA